MPLNKLDNFLKNVEGRILYVSPSDLDASDAMSNQGNSQTTPFKTIQRALIEAARFSYVPGNNNDITEKTTILLMPGEHVIDNRPGYKVKNDSGVLQVKTAAGVTVPLSELELSLESNFDLNDSQNILRKYNSIEGGVIVPRGTSIVGLDLRKTKIRPKYVPNPTDPEVPNTAIFRITGACYFWQFSIFDGSLSDKVYTDPNTFSANNFVKPSFSHHKLTCFEYADGVTKDDDTNLTDLNMYYYKLSLAYGNNTGDRSIPLNDRFPSNTEGFASKRPEFEIVGAFAADPLQIVNIISGNGSVAAPKITVTTELDHGLDIGTPIRIKGVSDSRFNISTTVTGISATNPKEFEYTLEKFDNLITAAPNSSGSTVIVETDTVNGASPYIFNISLRSVFGMNGMHADGSKATGFRSMVVAQFTGVSLQKDDRAFVKYDPTSRVFNALNQNRVDGTELASGSSATGSGEIYHLDSDAIYRSGWETRHVKISNNSILQIVSVFAIGYGIHFEAQSGSDASITNSNSNFGQIALVSDGFRKDAFLKDDRSFITHIIPPRAIQSHPNSGNEENIDYLPLDQRKDLTKKKLYLFGFNSVDIKPPALTQGFRVGAKVDDKLFVSIGGLIKSAEILMDDSAGGTKSSVKEITCKQVEGLYTSESGDHLLSTGEKIIVLNNDGDLPEGIEEKTTYFAIVPTGSTTTFRIASSKSNAENGEFIKSYSGVNDIFQVLSRVTDKNSGDIGHPIQFDSTVSQWYITVKSGTNTITDQLSNTAGTRTDPSFFKRVSDTRGLDEKIYKLRLSIPKEIDNSKDPENGFTIQESSTTGVRQSDDFTKNTLDRDDFTLDRNPRFISSCTFDSSNQIITITAERPHDLSVGEIIKIKNIKDSVGSSNGEFGKGYNGEFEVDEVVNDLVFKYKSGTSGLSAGALNDFDDQTTVSSVNYPRFERTDLKSNLYVYRNIILSNYINGNQDGVYQIFPVNASNKIDQEYQNLNFSQNVVDLFPQSDRDNINENPNASKTFAVRQPLGKVVTNDPLKSITRETVDKFMTKFGYGIPILTFTDSGDNTSGIVSFTKEHNLAGIVTARLNNTGGNSYTNGTHLNVKIFKSTTQTDENWNGTLAKVVVGSNNVTSAEITNAGSGWQIGEKGYFDTNRIAGNNSAFLGGSVAGAGLTVGNIGISSDLVIQTTGIGNTTDGYFKITSVNDKKRVSIAKSDTNNTLGILPQTGQYGFVVSPSSKITNLAPTSRPNINNNISLLEVTTQEPHGLNVGNQIQFNKVDHSKHGDYLVLEVVDVFKFLIHWDFVITDDYKGHILKHGLSANDGVSDTGDENLSGRGVDLFDIEYGKLGSLMQDSDTTLTIDTSTCPHVLQRFPFKSYLQIDEEIVRVSANSAAGNANNILTVIRGVFGTTISEHSANSLVKKLKPTPIQFNRPSILRASGHTFEYLGYGPGNYSTALPQVQVKTISEEEEFLSQAQERSAGAVVYTGMNNKGDFFIGNQKKSSLTGEETSFDTPIPTVAGEDPGRLSVVFDEVTVKERLVVEGGKSQTSLSEFDGPVTFNNEVQFKDAVKIKNTTDSFSPNSGALVISGGVGFAKTAHFADNSALKFGNSGDLMIAHEPNVSNSDLDANVIRSMSAGNTNKHLYLQTENKLVISDTTTAVQSAIFHVGNGVSLNHGTDSSGNNITRFSTLNTGPVGGGATVFGTMYAEKFYGSGADLTDINDSALFDSNGTKRVEAVIGGAQVTGGLTVGLDPTLGGNIIGKRQVVLDGTNESSGDILTRGGHDKIAFIRNTESQGEIVISGTLTDTQVNIARFKFDTNFNPTIESTGDIVAFVSDIRLKDEISPIVKALEKVKSINGFTYKHNEVAKLKCDINTGDQTYVGVSAQDVQKVLPEAVKPAPSNNDYLTVQYEKLVPLLIEAVKELSAKVDALENQINN